MLKSKFPLSRSLRNDTGVPVYLAPWAAYPPGVKIPAGSLPPGGQNFPGYLQIYPGYLAPHFFKIKFVFFDNNFNDK